MGWLIQKYQDKVSTKVSINQPVGANWWRDYKHR